MYRTMSLVERKKLQWAKEKEEMAALRSPLTTVKSIERLDNKLAIINQDYSKNPRGTPRRSSLPPLYKNNCLDKEKEIGGETSGYGSDHSPSGCVETWHQSGYESSSSRDDRPKWQGREEPFDKAATEPPNWVKRGLQDGEIIVSNTSPAESPEQRCEDSERPYTGSSCSQQRNTYIRGQNARIDSAELAERERRRQIALAHQEAIRQQLEERERRRKEERERRIKEEREEEQRIEREQEIERKKREAELKSFQEKQEKERKRKEAIQEAIELAQKEAQLEKLKRNRNVNLLDNCTEKNLPKEAPQAEYKHEEVVEDNEHKTDCNELNNSKQTSNRSEMLNNEVSSLEVKGKAISTPRSARENESQPDQEPPKEQLNNQPPFALTQNNALAASNPDNLALVFPPLETLQSYQYALLVPTTPQSLPIAVPINIPTTARSEQRTENRLLTPTQYRYKNKRLCDSATQTDDSYFRDSANKEKYLREKLTNLELTYENRIRKDRRSRSESLEERPKWGANRPPTRYVKQSEKDPLYQRRKLRQKMRESKNYEDKNSSDDSRTASPRYRKKDRRTQRALWRRNDQMFTRNIRMLKTEIIPLESDRDQLYYKQNSACHCGRHRCSSENVRVDILKIERSPRDTSSCREDRRERLPDVNDDIIDKLSCLHNGLLIKGEQWDDNSQSSLSSATRR
ncbi:unnamed protein product [Callosobruchus maculatus]|uniref:CCDC66 domain-containing protein n=1 Tax=Callosobruchus maculatus TaxID=64391 RepID=A0A653DKW0_CALMS|nr:unnamed protein product [Callosobruchus maculatus]